MHTQTVCTRPLLVGERLGDMANVILASASENFIAALSSLAYNAHMTRDSDKFAVYHDKPVVCCALRLAPC